MTELALTTREILVPSLRLRARALPAARRRRTGWILVAAWILMISAWLGLAAAVQSATPAGTGTSVPAARPAPADAPVLRTLKRAE